MEKERSSVELMVQQSQINVPYSWWAGETASRFFAGLRDEQKILATRCAACNQVFVPPRKTCPQCFKDTAWLEVRPEGELVTFTVARRQVPALPRPVPLVFGLIRLDGATTALLHLIGDVPPEQVRVGMRLKAKFATERRGGILDIEHFRPA
jgi:uncharacterized protein